MARPDAAPARLRITVRSAVLAVALLGATLAGLRVVTASQRVLGWMAAAAAVAGLLHPGVTWLARRMRRGAAATLVAVLVLGTIGGVGYSVAADVAHQTRRLQRALPQEAQRVERDGRFSEVARELHVADRTQSFVDNLPERLRGGTAATAIRSAATRGVAFLATGVLTLFLLLHGPRLAAAARDQLADPARRRRVEHVVSHAFRRAFGYARGTLGMAAAAGLVGYVIAVAADVPGPAPLALWIALWDAVPVLGVVIGSAPLVILAAASSPLEAVGVAAFFLAYQALETTVAQPWLEARTLRVGPFLTVVAGLVGLELYGLGGILLVTLAVALAAATLDELTTAP